MWLCVLVCVVLISTVYTSPVSSEGPTARSPREIIECCPCDGVRQSDAQGSCSTRSAIDDADAAPSILSPTALLAVKPVSSKGQFKEEGQPKEDPKNILQPEVEFASSFLNTLKEATDEEYKEALARDAARAVAKDADPDKETDVKAKENKLVTIIIDPSPETLGDQDTLIPEASHHIGTRCLDPLESLAALQSSGAPALHLFDQDMGMEASNIKQTYIDQPNSKSATPMSNRHKLAINPIDLVEDNTELLRNSGKNIFKNLGVTNGHSELNDAIANSVKNLVKLRDIDLLPKSTSNYESSDSNLAGKSKRFNIMPKIKKMYLKAILDTQPDGEPSASNILNRNFKGSPNYFESKRKKSNFNIMESPLKSQPQNMIHNRGHSELLKQIKKVNFNDNLGKSNFDRNQLSLVDNRPSSSDINEQAESFANSKSDHESAEVENPATPSRRSSQSTSLKKLSEVETTLLQPNKTMSNNNGVTTPALKELKRKFTFPTDKKILVRTEIFDDNTSPPGIRIDDENEFNPDKNLQTFVCEVNKQNALENKQRDSSEKNKPFINDNNSEDSIHHHESSEDFKREEDIINSYKSSGESNIQIVTEYFVPPSSERPGNAEIPEISNPETNDLSSDQTHNQNIYKNRILPKNRYLASIMPIVKINENFTPTKPNSTEFDSRSTDSSEIIITLSKPIESGTTPLSIIDEDRQNLKKDIIISLQNPDSSTLVDSDNENELEILNNEEYEGNQKISNSLGNKDIMSNRQQLEDIGSKSQNYFNPYKEINARHNNVHEISNNKKIISADSAPLGIRSKAKSHSLVTYKHIPISKANRHSQITEEHEIEPKSEQDLTEMSAEASDHLEVAHNFEKNYRQDKTVDSNYSNILPKLLAKNIEDTDLVSAMNKPQKSVVTSMKPLENIFQSKSRQASSLISQNPLNLKKSIKKYQTKLAVPESLGIQPLNLVSSLTDEDEQLSEVINYRPNARLKNILAAGHSNILGSATKLQDINYFKSKMKDDINLLNQQLRGIANPEIQQNVAESSSLETLSDKLRTQAENTVKNIQTSLASVFKGVKDSPNILGNSYTQSKDVIAELTQRHEDLKDKLEGIRYDLDDRFTTFQDDFLKSTRMLTNDNIMRMKPKITQPIIKAGSNHKKAQNRKNKMASAASSSIPETIAIVRPVFRTSIKPTKMSKKDENVLGMQPSSTKQTKTISVSPVTSIHKLLSSHSAPDLKQSKIKLDLPSEGHLDKEMQKRKTNFDNELKLKPDKNSKKAKDLNFSPSEKKTSNFNSETATSKEQPYFKDTKPLQRSRPSFITKKNIDKELMKTYAIPNIISKASNNSEFLNKIKELLKVRLAKKDKNKERAFKESTPSVDMAKAASENVPVHTMLSNLSQNEPVRENTNYKCKLMCVKDSP